MILDFLDSFLVSSQTQCSEGGRSIIRRIIAYGSWQLNFLKVKWLKIMRLCHYPSRHSESGAGWVRSHTSGGRVMSPPGVLMLTGGYSLITSEGGQWLSSGLTGR